MSSANVRPQPSIAYRGINSDGQPEGGFVTADSNQAAMQILHDKGIREVRLYGDASQAMNRHDLAGLSDDELAAWKAVSQPVYDSYLAATGDLGKSILDAAGK